jgi:phytoene dehydrogenase-like protein
VSRFPQDKSGTIKKCQYASLPFKGIRNAACPARAERAVGARIATIAEWPVISSLEPRDCELKAPQGALSFSKNGAYTRLLLVGRVSNPVRGLYLVGASTWPGAGVGAGSGFMLAKMLAGESVRVAALAV